MKSDLDKYKSWINTKITLDSHLVVEAEELGNDKVKAKIEFNDFLCWQCFDESASVQDKDEIIDSKGFISTISKSRYLDYANLAFGWYMDIKPPVKLYRIYSEDDIVEVITYQEPKVTIISESVNA